MPSYSVTVHDGPERGIRVRCVDHGHVEEFAAGRRRVAFHCDRCGYEVELTVHDLTDWRDLGERC